MWQRVARAERGRKKPEREREREKIIDHTEQKYPIDSLGDVELEPIVVTSRTSLNLHDLVLVSSS